MDWHPIETLQRDGCQVRFRSPHGEFTAPAGAAEKLTSKEAAAIVMAGGEWPNVKYDATHWRELGPECPHCGVEINSETAEGREDGLLCDECLTHAVDEKI